MKLQEHIDFQGIKEKVDLREIARDCGLIINRRGFVCCPFHHEKTPSMRVEKEYYYCFGCHDNGDVFDFLMRLNGWNLMKAVEYLNDRYHLGLKRGMSRREKAEVEEEVKLRNAFRDFEHRRKREINGIANKYTEEYRTLFQKSMKEQNEVLNQRLAELNEVLDEYQSGNWPALIAFYEHENDRQHT